MYAGRMNYFFSVVILYRMKKQQFVTSNISDQNHIVDP